MLYNWGTRPAFVIPNYSWNIPTYFRRFPTYSRVNPTLSRKFYFNSSNIQFPIDSQRNFSILSRKLLSSNTLFINAFKIPIFFSIFPNVFETIPTIFLIIPNFFQLIRKTLIRELAFILQTSSCAPFFYKLYLHYKKTA